MHDRPGDFEIAGTRAYQDFSLLEKVYNDVTVRLQNAHGKVSILRSIFASYSELQKHLPKNPLLQGDEHSQMLEQALDLLGETDWSQDYEQSRWQLINKLESLRQVKDLNQLRLMLRTVLAKEELQQKPFYQNVFRLQLIVARLWPANERDEKGHLKDPKDGTPILINGTETIIVPSGYRVCFKQSLNSHFERVNTFAIHPQTKEILVLKPAWWSDAELFRLQEILYFRQQGVTVPVFDARLYNIIEYVKWRGQSGNDRRVEEITNEKFFHAFELFLWLKEKATDFVGTVKTFFNSLRGRGSSEIPEVRMSTSAQIQRAVGDGMPAPSAPFALVGDQASNPVDNEVKPIPVYNPAYPTLSSQPMFKQS